jgi:predicted CXXCH cytochrome family protein
MERKETKRKATAVLLTLLFVVLALLLLACSPRSTAKTSVNDQNETEQQNVISIQWSPETDCGACHIVEAESAANPSCDAYLHTTTSCVDCHDNTNKLKTMHEDVTTADRMPTRLKQTTVTEETCVGCHALDEAHIEATATEALVDINETKVNPHNLPATETDSHAEIICSDCHEMHDSAAKRVEKATKLCQSCHHSGVYECYTCHEHG